ncbi:MAG: GNAT family N-acetyltransferase [Flavobacteriaceae bacterium]|jgi:GNAT superfamily N-acetyltransferase|nr:GNAT family N-acetyltransferase [Flavobacteriaceae bacterium]MBT3753699.1 GNAT family N-acetyltransferase [Flavobacteriaceae bacterium]MBT3794791.1 GNAT family N-acetyltransferase [Flavobacteriaceae bacterium]MBT4063440.1 GNAT family N-acetyltransferase [Flavobacteriaceae bacterium]MBT4246366.1 GNAT family N-acetyltransferase [Flavobacteriaceae bacterium]|tara:strand:+ start:1889 stop:2368 length:480 start_codon:yes stop_codon:yes gene_type:complete
MNLIIRIAEREDMKSVLLLINELAEFERETDVVNLTYDDLIRDGFSDPPLFVCFVAVLNNQIVGMSLGYSRYSTWKGKTMHLEDLIVTEKERGTGIGNALFSNFIKYSHSKGVKRIEWAVLNWNINAIKFYESKGAVVYDDWHIAQMNETAIKNFISNK